MTQYFSTRTICFLLLILAVSLSAQAHKCADCGSDLTTGGNGQQVCEKCQSGMVPALQALSLSANGAAGVSASIEMQGAVGGEPEGFNDLVQLFSEAIQMDYVARLSSGISEAVLIKEMRCKIDRGGGVQGNSAMKHLQGIGDTLNAEYKNLREQEQEQEQEQQVLKKAIKIVAEQLQKKGAGPVKFNENHNRALQLLNDRVQTPSPGPSWSTDLEYLKLTYLFSLHEQASDLEIYQETLRTLFRYGSHIQLIITIVGKAEAEAPVFWGGLMPVSDEASAEREVDLYFSQGEHAIRIPERGAMRILMEALMVVQDNVFRGSVKAAVHIYQCPNSDSEKEDQ